MAAFIDMDKEYFVGKKALIHADKRTLLYGLKSQAAAPAMGDEVLEGAAVVGRVTAGAVSPYLSCGIVYVRFKTAGDWAGKNLMIKSADGKSHQCEIVELPFYDKEKKIPRGIDRTIP